MTVAFALIGPFQSLPSYVKSASNQPNFDKWHAVLLLNGTPHSFIDEYTGEVDYYIGSDGMKHLTFTDCVPAVGCDAISALLGQNLDYHTREQLQSEMGTKPTQTDPFAGANLTNLKNGVAKMWPNVETVLSNAWAAIRDGSNDGSGYCWIFEPMAKNKAPQRVKIADMYPFVAANNNQYLKFIQPTLPDSSTQGEDMDPINDIPVAFCTVGQTWFFSDPSLAGSTQIQATNGLAKVGLYWQNSRATALRVAFGSHNTNLRVVYVPNASVSNIRISDVAADCSKQDATIVAQTNTIAQLKNTVASLTNRVNTIKSKVAANAADVAND